MEGPDLAERPRQAQISRVLEISRVLDLVEARLLAVLDVVDAMITPGSPTEGPLEPQDRAAAAPSKLKGSR